MPSDGTKKQLLPKRLRFLEEVILTNILMDEYRIFPVKLRNQCPDGEMMGFLSNSDDESVVKIAVDYQKNIPFHGFQLDATFIGVLDLRSVVNNEAIFGRCNKFLKTWMLLR